MKRILLPLLAAGMYFNVQGQGELPVNMYTGTPGVFVKLYTLADHDLSETISLTYNTNALRLNTPRTYGVGWGLDAGGQLTREVRGLPDDYAAANPDTRKGWLYNSNSVNAANFSNSSDLSTSTCSDEQTDNSFFSNLNYNMDTEPDLFSFTAGGISGQFIFSNNRVISLIPYQDISIVPTFKGANPDFTITNTNIPDPFTIMGWTITTNDGKIYTFGTIGSFTTTSTATKGLSRNNNDNLITLTLREYMQYWKESLTTTPTVLGSIVTLIARSSLSYNASWMLNTVTSPTGASLTYAYTSVPTGSSEWRTFSIFKPGTTPTRENLFLMMEYTTSTLYSIQSITTSSGSKAVFTNYDDIAITDVDRSSTPMKHFRMMYSSGFLTSITETDDSNCTQMPPYKFYYNNSSAYPQSGATSQDFWGFYNGAVNSLVSYTPTVYCYPNEPAKDRYRIYPIPNYTGTQVTLTGSGNRLPNADAILTGTLARIVYPTGGETDLTFEPHRYYDSRAGIDQFGGGLRIKSALYYDGVNPSANILKNFTYTDANGHSSGRIISMPVFAVPLYKFYNGTTSLSYSTLAAQSTSNLWNGITAVSQLDMNPTESTSGSTVGYTMVTVARPGNGKAVFEYLMPAGYGDAATGNAATDWQPTVMKFARSSACPSMNQIQAAEAWGYPAFNNTYYDYERGLLSKKSEFNEAGTLIRTTQPTYQYVFKSGTAPTSTIGIAYDVFANSDAPTFLYGRYAMLGDVVKVVSTETVVTYDENNASRYSTESTQYEYTSSYHRLVNKVTRTVSDGTIYRNYLKYTLDYPISTQPTDVPLYMVSLLKSANRLNTVIEQINTVTLPGGTEKTSSASLVKFDPFNSSPVKPELKYQLAFRPSAPVTDFVASSVNVNYAFANDQRYEIINTVNEYDKYDTPISSTGEDNVTSGILLGYNQRVPVVQYSQSQSTNLAFSDFETTSVSSFLVTNGYYGTGRTGSQGIYPYATLNSYRPGPNPPARAGITKPANTTSYWLTFWALPLPQNGPQSITLTVTLSYGSTNASQDYPFYFDQNVDVHEYQFFKQAINVSGVNTSQFNISIQGVGFSAPTGGTFLASRTPLLDDVAFYPADAVLTTSTYDMPFGVSSATDASGKTAFTTYDAMGRPKLSIDQGHNIRKRNSYAATGQILPTTIVAAVSSIIGKYETNTPIQFVASPLNCLTGVTYEWNFGSGYTSPSTSNISPSQTYATTGQRSLTLRVTHAVYGQATTTFTYTINPPLSATLCATGVKTMNITQITDTYSCFTNPNPSSWITVKVPLNDNDLSTWTFQWKELRVGTNTWTLVPNNSTNMYGRQVLWREGSFQIKCTVSTSDGRTVDSDIITVTTNPSGQ